MITKGERRVERFVTRHVSARIVPRDMPFASPISLVGTIERSFASAWIEKLLWEDGFSHYV